MLIHDIYEKRLHGLEIGILSNLSIRSIHDIIIYLHNENINLLNSGINFHNPQIIQHLAGSNKVGGGRSWFRLMQSLALTVSVLR